MNTDNIKDTLNELSDDLKDASLSYDMWRELTDANNMDDFKEVLHEHSFFFQTIIHANLVTFIITLYRLFENKNNTINIPNFISEIYESKSLPDSINNRIMKYVDEITDTWKKICILRSNVFGHKSRKLNPESAFVKAEITPDQMEKIISDMQDLLNIIRSEIFNTRDTFNEEYRCSVHDVIKLLKKNR